MRPTKTPKFPTLPVRGVVASVVVGLCLIIATQSTKAQAKAQDDALYVLIEGCKGNPQRCPPDRLEALIEAGADPNYTARSGSTVLELANLFLGAEELEVLVNAGARAKEHPDPEVGGLLHRWAGRLQHSCNQYGDTLPSSSVKKFDLLLRAGADIDAVRWGGRTPLMTAARLGLCLDAIRLIAEHGADVHARTEEGRSALDFAEEYLQSWKDRAAGEDPNYSSMPEKFFSMRIKGGSQNVAFLRKLTSSRSNDSQPDGGPKLPFVLKDVCPYETCTYGRAIADETIPVYANEGELSEQTFKIAKNQVYKEVTGNLHVFKKHKLTVSETHSATDYKSGPVSKLELQRGDELYALAYLGEGLFAVWHDQEVHHVFERQSRWDDWCATKTFSPADCFEWVWWIQVRDRQGRSGWIVGGASSDSLLSYYDTKQAKGAKEPAPGVSTSPDSPVKDLVAPIGEEELFEDVVVAKRLGRAVFSIRLDKATTYPVLMDAQLLQAGVEVRRGDRVAIEGRIYRLNDSIRQRWVRVGAVDSARAGEIPNTPSFLLADSLTVRAFTGTKWHFETEDEVRSSPAVADGVVYVGSYDDNLYAVDAETGQERWRFETDDDVSSSSAVADGVVYVGSEDTNLYAVDAETGQERWRFATQHVVLSSPAVADGVVYVGSWDTNLYAVDAETGQELWRFETGSVVRSSPAVADGVVYVGSQDGHLYALDSESGEERWRFETGGAVYSPPAVVDGLVYVGSWDNYLYALDAETGEERWRFETEGYVISSPAVADGVVYVGSSDNRLYALIGGETEVGGYRPSSPYDVRPRLKNGADVHSFLQRIYPPMLKEAGIGGRVILRIFVDETGSVQQARVRDSGGYKVLDEAAKKVAFQMEFSPALKRDKKTAVWIDQPVTFEVK